MNFFYLFPLPAVLALSACGGVPIADVRAALANTKPCCTTYADLPVVALQEGSRMKFELGTTSPAFVSPAGLAYSAAFSLPPRAQSLSVQALNTQYLPNASYPDPFLVFLDSGKRPLQQVADLNLQRSRHAIISGIFEYFYGARVSVPSMAEYVVVFAHPASTRVQRAVSENGTTWPVLPAPVGTLALIPN